MARLLRLTRGRRRCRDGSGAGQSGHTLQPPTFAVERFEHVEVDSASTLLRIVGRQTEGNLWSGTLELVVKAGERVHRHRLLAPPARIGAGEEGDGGSRLQLAFAVPSGLADDPLSRFELALDERPIVELGPPTRINGVETTLRARLEHEHALRIHAEEQAADRSQDLADARALLEQEQRRCAISERNLAELRDKLVLAWTESKEMRDLIDLGEARHEATKLEARRRRATERELRALLGRQERDLVAARENVERQCETLAAELTQRKSGERLAREELEIAREREIALQEAARSARETFEQAQADADQTRALLDKSEEATSRVAAERAELEEQVAALKESAQTEQSQLKQEIEALRSSEKIGHEQLIRAQKELESARSGRRGRMRKALSDAETERRRLESELSGLLLHLGDLEEKLAESKAFDPHVLMTQDHSAAS
jgi:hypothetical protein